MSQSRREAFSVEHTNQDKDPGFVDKWFGIRDGDTTGEPQQSSASVARLVGGYRTNNDAHYRPFPGRVPHLLDFIGESGTGQGELFNWEHPQIKGLYRGDNSTGVDLGNALGIAAAESKKRFGVEPLEDEALADESAKVTKKLTGRDNPVTYHAGWGKKESRAYGNMMANMIDRRARESSSSEILPASAIEEGRTVVRNKLAEMRKPKNQDSKNIIPNPQESRVSAFKQTIIPGMETIG